MKNGRIHLLSLTLMCLLLCGCLSGCSQKSAEEKDLLQKISRASAANQITYANYIMDFHDSGSILTMTFDIWSDPQKNLQYSEANAYIKIGEISLNEDMVLYAEQHDNCVSTYMYSLLMNKWTYEKEVFDSAQQAKASYFGSSMFPSLSQLSNTTLDWNTALIDAKKTYIVHYTWTGSELLSLINSSGLDASGTDNVNMSILSQYNFPIKYYVDTKTNLPIKIELSIVQKPKEKSLMDKILNKKEKDVYVPSFSLIIKDISYEQQELPVVPDKIKKEYEPELFENSDVPESSDDENETEAAPKETIPDPETDATPVRPKFKRKK